MPTTKLKNTAYLMLLPFMAPACAAHPVSSVSGHDLNSRRTFESLIRRHHVLGSCVLLTSGMQKTLICTASVSPKHEAHPETYFRVASITKMATAILTMKLCDEQILDPDRPAGEYFDSSAACSSLDGIRLRHLLSHTSGLTDPSGLESYLEAGVPFTAILSEARRFRPGSCFQYSNLGFGLIGCILESVLEQPVGQIFRERLFEPLDMNATLEGCLLPTEQIMPVTRILPYHRDQDLILTRLGSEPLRQPDPLRHYGHTAGSMYTDVLSLQKLLDVVIRNQQGFLSDRSLEVMREEHASYGTVSPTLSYGYGLLKICDPAVSVSPVFGHQGFAYGCADGAFWEESTGRTMIMLNGGSSEARNGRLGLLNRDLLRWAFRKELPSW